MPKCYYLLLIFEVSKSSNEMSSNKISFYDGLKLGLPIMIGYIPLGFAFGVLAVKNGVDAFWAVMMSVFVFAGAGQFITVGMLGAGASFLSIGFANLLVNLRHILMSAALVTPWKQIPFGWKMFLAFFQTDEIFAANISHYKSGKEVTVCQILTLALVAHSGWILGTLLGAVSGSLITNVEAYGLDFALPAMFAALLVPLLVDRIQVIVCLTGAAASLCFMQLGFDRWSIILATLLSASAGLYLALQKEKNTLG